LLSDSIPDAISSSDNILMTIPEYTEAISEAIHNSNPEAIPKAIPKAISKAISEANSDHSHCSTLRQDGGFR
jgi:hypothetical protein